MFRDITKFIIESKFNAETVMYLISSKLNNDFGDTLIMKQDRIVLDIEYDFEVKIIGFNSKDYS